MGQLLVIDQSLCQSLLVEFGAEVGHRLHLAHLLVHGGVHDSFSFSHPAISIRHLAFSFLGNQLDLPGATGLPFVGGTVQA